MGKISGTPNDEIALYRCSPSKIGPGCGRVVSEYQLEKGRCPHCGGRYFTGYYPMTWWQKVRAYAGMFWRGELWV